MENNGKGTSIFYGVIGVATLIITIIGATFAYFSATTNSDEGAVAAGGATLTLGFSDDKTGYKNNLIPVDVTLPEFDTGGFVGDGENDCQDINGNNICSVYEFTIKNPDTNKASQRVYGSIVPSTNTFTNFKLAVFKGTVEEVNSSTKTHEVSKEVVSNEATNIDTYTEIKLSDVQALDKYKDAEVNVGDTVQVPVKIGWDVDGTAVEAYTTDFDHTAFTNNAADASRKHVIGDPGDLVFTGVRIEKDSDDPISIPAWEQVLDIGEEMTYTIVMWIPEMDAEQNADQGKAFAAAVNFTTEGNGTGVTGVLSTTSR